VQSVGSADHMFKKLKRFFGSSSDAADRPNDGRANAAGAAAGNAQGSYQRVASNEDAREAKAAAPPAAAAAAAGAPDPAAQQRRNYDGYPGVVGGPGGVAPASQYYGYPGAMAAYRPADAPPVQMIQVRVVEQAYDLKMLFQAMPLECFIVFHTCIVWCDEQHASSLDPLSHSYPNR